MKQSTFLVKLAVFLLFALGVTIGLWLAVGTTIAAMESNFYFGYGLQGQEKFKDMSCPVMLNRHETGIVEITIENPNDRNVSPAFQVDISNVGLFRSSRSVLSVPANGYNTIRWSVSAEDAVFGNYILVQVFQYYSFNTPTRDGHCGIVVVDLPMSGNLILALAIALSLLFMGGGIALWASTNRPAMGSSLTILRALVAILITVSISMLLGIFELWLPAVFVIAITLLLIGEVLRSLITA